MNFVSAPSVWTVLLLMNIAQGFIPSKLLSCNVKRYLLLRKQSKRYLNRLLFYPEEVQEFENQSKEIIQVGTLHANDNRAQHITKVIISLIDALYF